MNLNFLALEKEVTKAEIARKNLLIEMDANSKLGPFQVPGDKLPQNDNVRLLAGIIDQHVLLIGNSLPQCEGIITPEQSHKRCY